MEEIWKDIEGYEGIYKISNKGNIWSIPRMVHGQMFGGKMVKQRIDHRQSNDRIVVELSKNGKARRYIPARLVATAFIRPPQDGEEINHLDENPMNNCVENLEWCTHKYNCNYGTRIQRIKEKQNIPVLQYTLNGEFIAEYASMHIAAEAINADAGHICDCCIGNRRKAYGFFWRYKDDALYVVAKERIKKKIADSAASRSAKFTEKAYNVVQLDMDGNYIATYPSSKYAAESIKAPRPMIISCCNGKIKHARGYKWVYEKDYTPAQPKKRNVSAVQMDLFG